jgi:hypothetical protein
MTSSTKSETIPSGSDSHQEGGNSWMDEEIRQLDEEFSRYMHARQSLHHLSDRTLRRYLPERLRRKRAYNRIEREFSHRVMAAYYTYQKQSLLCAKAGADFAAALMAVSATECLLLLAFLELKGKVMQTAEYKRIIRRGVLQKRKKGAKTPKKAQKTSFQQFMASLQIAEQYKIAFELDLVRDQDTDGVVGKVLRSYKSKGALGLLHFVKNSRNQLHTGKLVSSIDSYALVFDVMYSSERIAQYHADFALCAYHMMGTVNSNLDRIRTELAAVEERIQHGDEAEE